MDMKHIARSAVVHWMEQQKTSSPTNADDADLRADAARMLNLLSGLLTEMAEELVAAGIQRVHTATGNRYKVVEIKR